MAVSTRDNAEGESALRAVLEGMVNRNRSSTEDFLMRHIIARLRTVIGRVLNRIRSTLTSTLSSCFDEDLASMLTVVLNAHVNRQIRAAHAALCVVRHAEWREQMSEMENILDTQLVDRLAASIAAKVTQLEQIFPRHEEEKRQKREFEARHAEMENVKNVKDAEDVRRLQASVAREVETAAQERGERELRDSSRISEMEDMLDTQLVDRLEASIAAKVTQLEQIFPRHEEKSQKREFEARHAEMENVKNVKDAEDVRRLQASVAREVETAAQERGERELRDSSRISEMEDILDTQLVDRLEASIAAKVTQLEQIFPRHEEKSQKREFEARHAEMENVGKNVKDAEDVRRLQATVAREVETEMEEEVGRAVRVQRARDEKKKQEQVQRRRRQQQRQAQAISEARAQPNKRTIGRLVHEIMDEDFPATADEYTPSHEQLIAEAKREEWIASRTTDDVRVGDARRDLWQFFFGMVLTERGTAETNSTSSRAALNAEFVRWVRAGVPPSCGCMRVEV